MEMHAFGRLLPMEDAQRRLLRAARPISRTEPVELGSAFGRVAARSLAAPRPVPEFARATWDGYAVRSGDARAASPARPVRLRVVGEVYAEQRYSRRLRSGEAVAIATGGALPAGADAVAIFEAVRREGPELVLSHPVRAGDRIAPPGDDFPRGTSLVRAGEALSPAVLGSLAACGFASVRCFARPVVAIVPNGNELLVPGARRRAGAIYESNNVSLSALLTAVGAVPRPYPPVPDDPARIEAVLREALATSDVVLATGGSSVGERDYLPRVLPRLGRLLFHGIAVRPGKPTLAATAGGKLIVGLPGHPSSCVANSFWLVLPVLHRVGRRPEPAWVETTVRLGAGVLAPSPGLATVVPVALRNGRAYSTYHGSASISSMAGAQGYVVLTPGTARVRAGERVRVRWLAPPLGPGLSPLRP
jgi:molybdenum cofactor synthesis domain-containing protein